MLVLLALTTQMQTIHLKTLLCCCCQVTSVVSDSVRPHRRQPTKLSCPWDSPGKNTGMGCHFLLQCMKVESESEVARHKKMKSFQLFPPKSCHFDFLYSPSFILTFLNRKGQGSQREKQ